MDTWTPGLWATENPTIAFGDTLSPELPSAGYDLNPTLFVATGDANTTGGEVSGVLSFAKATADSLLGAWGTIQGFQRTKAEMDLARQTAAGEIAVRSAQAQSAKEVAILQAETTASVERSRAEAQRSIAAAQAHSAKTGTVYVPAGSQLSLGLILALGFGAYVVLNNRGKK